MTAPGQKFKSMRHLQVSGSIGSRWIRASLGAYPPKIAVWRGFSRSPSRVSKSGRPEFLLESLSILRVVVVIVGGKRRWIRAATLSTNS